MHFDPGQNTVTALKLALVHFKHSDVLHPVNILIYSDEPVCPVSLVRDYLALRGLSSGPLFCWPGGQPILRSFFSTSLRQALHYCGLDSERYKSHSFRIGAASWAASKGLSDAQIRVFGRWKSNAFLKYIRNPSLASHRAHS